MGLLYFPPEPRPDAVLLSLKIGIQISAAAGFSAEAGGLTVSVTQQQARHTRKCLLSSQQVAAPARVRRRRGRGANYS
eukprot:COSAG01_NODE_179_length_22923_cov_25.190535_32_plen_78_part_00